MLNLHCVICQCTYMITIIAQVLFGLSEISMNRYVTKQKVQSGCIVTASLWTKKKFDLPLLFF